MEKNEIISVVIDTVKDHIGPDRLTEIGTIDQNTPLFGREGILDSIGLVNVVLDVERVVNERAGRAIALADDRAMSQARSPFQSAVVLANYVEQLLQEKQP